MNKPEIETYKPPPTFNWQKKTNETEAVQMVK